MITVHEPARRLSRLAVLVNATVVDDNDVRMIAVFVMDHGAV